MTTEAKHTDGPWEACDRGEYGDFDGDSIVILGDDMRIAVVHCKGEPWQVANARLIAAAPDLLTATAKALNYLENTEGELGITLESADACRAALAKASGA